MNQNEIKQEICSNTKLSDYLCCHDTFLTLTMLVMTTLAAAHCGENACINLKFG